MMMMVGLEQLGLLFGRLSRVSAGITWHGCRIYIYIEEGFDGACALLFINKELNLCVVILCLPNSSINSNNCNMNTIILLSIKNAAFSSTLTSSVYKQKHLDFGNCVYIC